LEEGLATCFSHAYVKRVYGVELEPPDHRYGAAMRAVSPLLAKNEFVIKELRVRQPLISKIDETLLVEVAGIEPDQARFLCAEFENYWRATPTWSEQAAQGAQLFVDGLRSFRN
jgi:hypothetical protein